MKPRLRTRATVAALAGAAFALLVALAATSRGLSSADAALLGVVEGITEFLPVSSTGHLTVVQRLLDIGTSKADKAAADAYAICVQAGAIAAVSLVYRRRLGSIAAGVAGRDRAGSRLAMTLLAGFVPAAVLGVALGDGIQDRLFGVGPVVAAWVAGGIVILAVAPRWPGGERTLEVLTVRHGLIVGLAQSLALWPGVSRSLVTIVAGLMLGLSPVAAVELSFLLGLVTLGAATVFEAVKDGPLVVETFGWMPIGIGLLAALVSAVAAVRWLVDYLGRRGLQVFGWYRLGVAAVVSILLVIGAV